MADNILVTPGTGATVAADDIGGALHQRIKIVWGVDGAGVDASASNPLPVVQTGTPGLPTGAATEATLVTIDGRVDGIEALLTTIDGRVDGLETLITATNAVLGVGASAQLKAEDAVAASGDAGIMALGVRADTPAATAANGDYVPLLVDATGKLWTAGLYAEDVAHASGDYGSMSLAVRTDAGTALAGTTGDYIPLSTDALGRLWVAGSQAEDVASADGDRGMAALAVRKATPANTSGTDGDYEFLQISAGRLWVSGVTTQMTPGTGATDLGKAEDAAHTTGDTGVMALAVRNDTPAALAGTTLDYIPLTTDRDGRLHVRESVEDAEAVAASQTDQALGATGAAGDILTGVLIVPATVSPGAVSVKDGAGSAVTIFAGGTNSVLSLHSFFVPYPARSASGAWKITTGANVSAVGFGDFT